MKRKFAECVAPSLGKAAYLHKTGYHSKIYSGSRKKKKQNVVGHTVIDTRDNFQQFFHSFDKIPD